jgi:hypothetical protein
LTAILFSVLLLNILILLSLRLVRQILSVYEITVNVFVVSSIAHLAFSSVSLNMKRIEFIETQTVFWILEMYRLVFIPCLYIWVLAACFHQQLRLLQKIIVAIWWFALVIGMQQTHHILGLSKFNNWNIGWSLIEFSVIFFLCIPFSFWFRNLLREEELVKCL